MCELWNELDLKKPPLIVLPVKNCAFVQKVFVAINIYFREIKIKNQEFEEAAALLSRLYARRQNSFRHMIGFRAVRKLNAALRRLLVIDLTRELETFRSSLPDIGLYDNHVEDIPTRQNLEYVLVRCITVQRIHERIQICCKQIAAPFFEMLSGNCFVDFLTLLLSNVAVINARSAFLGNKCIDLYGKLLIYHMNFPATDYEFLPDDTTLPQHLERFECVPETKETKEQASVKLADSPTLVKKLKKEQKVDVGKVVERDEQQTPKSKINAVKPKFNVEEKLTNITEIKKFIASETEARKKSLASCITKDLLNHEWLAAKKIFERKLLANDDKKALSIFCKFLSSKIK